MKQYDEILNKVAIWRENKECVVFRGFFIYKAYDYGIYLLTHDSVEMEDNISPPQTLTTLDQNETGSALCYFI